MAQTTFKPERCWECGKLCKGEYFEDVLHKKFKGVYCGSCWQKLLWLNEKEAAKYIKGKHKCSGCGMSITWRANKASGMCRGCNAKRRWKRG